MKNRKRGDLLMVLQEINSTFELRRQKRIHANILSGILTGFVLIVWLWIWYTMGSL